MARQLAIVKPDTKVFSNFANPVSQPQRNLNTETISSNCTHVTTAVKSMATSTKSPSEAI